VYTRSSPRTHELHGLRSVRIIADTVSGDAQTALLHHVCHDSCAHVHLATRVHQLTSAPCFILALVVARLCTTSNVVVQPTEHGVCGEDKAGHGDDTAIHRDQIATT
jgi:hypothetical protein